MFLANTKVIVFCSALRADFLFKCGWLTGAEAWSGSSAEGFKISDLDFLSVFVFRFFNRFQQISTVVSRFCFCCCQGRPGIPLHCCAHVGVSCWANTVVTFVCFTPHHCTFVCVPVHPSYTLAPGQSLQSLLFKSTPSHASKEEIHEVCSLSALPTAFSISCVFTLLALLSVHSTCGQTACHVFVGYLYQLGPGSLVLSLRGARWFGPKDSFIENGDLGDLGRKRCRCRNFAAIVRALAAKLGCLINKPFSLCLFVFFSPSPVFRDAS